jgi:hypothetical protein
MEYASDSGALNATLAIVTGLACAVVAWKSIEYVLDDLRRRRENPPPDGDPRA